MNIKVVASLASGAVISAVLGVGAWVLGGSAEERAINFAVVAVGMAVGWLLGVLASPYDVTEKKQFSELSRALSLFVSGYALAKVSRLVDALVSPDLLLQPVAGFRGLSLLGAVVSAALVTFVARQYWRVD